MAAPQTLHDETTGRYAAGDTRAVESGDARIAYRVKGAGELPVFVLQPFWTSMSDVLDGDRTLGALLAERYRVIAHDRRGTGASQRHPETITLDAMLDDLIAVLDDADTERAVIIGIGEAATLAVHLAAAHPERVTRLALVDATLRPVTGPGSTMLLHSLRAKPRAGLRALARTLVADDDAATAQAARMSHTVDGATAARLYEVYLAAEAAEALPKASAPAQFICGVYDRHVSEDEAATFRSRMADARVAFVGAAAGSDHALDEAWTVLAAFLGEVTERPQPRAAAKSPARATARPRSRAHTAARSKPADFVPFGPPPGAWTPMPMPMPAFTQQIVGAPLASAPAPNPVRIAWGPPQNIPAEAITLNRKGIDQLLIGHIEDALESFRAAVELAPHFEDAVINHRELLTRLVQRRVYEWQTQHVEQAMADAERRAQQWTERNARAKRRGLGWLLGRA